MTSTAFWLVGLKARRIALNKRPADLARLIQVTPTSYFRYEAGSRQLTLDKAFMLADELAITVDELRRFDPEMERPIVPAAPYIKVTEPITNTGLVVPAAYMEVPEGWDSIE